MNDIKIELCIFKKLLIFFFSLYLHSIRMLKKHTILIKYTHIHVVLIEKLQYGIEKHMSLLMKIIRE